MCGPGQRQRGIALIVVLWTILAVALISSLIVGRARQDLRLARNLAERAAVELAVDGAINLTIAQLAGTEQVPLYPAQPARLTINNVLVELGVEPEAGRLDLNAAPPKLIEALLRSLGFSAGDASRATELIAEHRSDSGGRQLGDFALPSDLVHVWGLPDEIRRAMLPYVTTFTGLSRPVGTTALAPVRQAMIALKQDGPVPSDAPALWLGSSAAAQLTGPARLFRISAVASGPDSQFARTAVVSIGASGDQPYRILCWQCAPADQ